MKPSLYGLLGNYSALIHRLDSQSASGGASNNLYSGASSTLKTQHAALLAAHQKLQDAMHEFETLAAEAVTAVNRSLAGIKTTDALVVPPLEQHAEYAMQAGALYLSDLAASQTHSGEDDQVRSLLGSGNPNSIS